MKTKLQLLLLTIPLAVLGMTSASFADNYGDKDSWANREPYPYISPTPGEFPIMSWGMQTETSAQVYRDFVDCGFNAALVFNSHFPLLIPALNPVAGQDTIKVNLIPRFEWHVDTVNHIDPKSMPYYMDRTYNNYLRYATSGNRTPITGWMLTDEPAFYKFDYQVPFFRTMAQYDTTRMTWTNLYGDPQVKDKLSPNGNNSAKEALRYYIETFCEKFKPGVLTYDYYPFVLDTLHEKDPGYVKNSPKFIDATIKQNRLHDFYTALQLYSEISKKRNRPFWAFCQSRATCVNEDFDSVPGHPTPTEEYLRYEAFNALAFGAQGIQHFSYKEEFVRPENLGSPYYAPVTADGRKTPVWDIVRKVNKEIKDHTHVFLGAKLDSYYFVGDPRDTAYCDYRRGSSVNAISVRDLNAGDTVGSNRGALVSTLVNDGRRYVVIVNQSPYEPARLELAINDRDYEVSRLQSLEPATLGSEPADITNAADLNGIDLDVRRFVRINLAPAQYAIYQYSPKSSSKM